MIFHADDGIFFALSALGPWAQAVLCTKGPRVPRRRGSRGLGVAWMVVMIRFSGGERREVMNQSPGGCWWSAAMGSGETQVRARDDR
ncbi:hypothetical protein IWX91DRAFT_343230 [Phyllosticta citricarpa]